MVSLADLIGTDALVRQVNGPEAPASVQRVVLARSASDPGQGDWGLLVVPGNAQWWRDDPALLEQAGAVVVVGDDQAADGLAALGIVPVLVPGDRALTDAVEVWARLLERSERAAVRRADLTASLARLAAKEVSGGATSPNRLMDMCARELGARLQILQGDSDVPEWGPDWPELHTLVTNVGRPVALDHVIAIPAGPRELPTILLAEREAGWDEASLELLEQLAEWASALLWGAEVRNRSRVLAEQSRALRVAAFQAVMANDMRRAARTLQMLAPGLVDAGAGAIAVIEAAPGESRAALVTDIDRAFGRQTLAVMCPVNDRQIIVLHPAGAGGIDDLVRPVVSAGSGRAAGISPMTPWPRAATAYEAALAALTSARGTLDKIRTNPGAAPLIELLGVDARVWAALVLQPVAGDPERPGSREELLTVAGETLQWGESEAARLVGRHRHTLADRLTALFEATGFDRTDVWHRSALYLAVRLSQLPPPLVITHRVTLEDVLNHDDARAWARNLLKPLSPDVPKPLSPDVRRVLVAWARCEQRPARAMKELEAEGHGMSRAQFYRRLQEAAEATGLEFASYPGPLAEILVALHIVGDVPMGTLPSMSGREIVPATGLDDTCGSVQELNPGVPHPARIYDYFLGGRMHFASDRAAARAVSDINPYTAFACQQSRRWMERAVEHVVLAGCDQILDIGTGIPTSPNVHEVAQRVNRRARVVYADNDPIVLYLAKSLLESTEEGRTAYVQADFLRGSALFDLPEFSGGDPVIDLARPVALSINSLVHFVPGEVAYELVAALMARLVPGSFLILSSLTADFAPEIIGRAMAAYSDAVIPAEPRSEAGVRRFFTDLDLDLVEPGVVPYPLWHPGPDDIIPPLDHVNGYCGVGRLSG